MNKRTIILPATIILLLFAAVLLFILVMFPNGSKDKPNDSIVASDGTPVHLFTDENGQLVYSPITDFPTAEIICYTESDINVIPDKYNTGADLTKAIKTLSPEDYDSICRDMIFSRDDNYIILNFYNNKYLKGDYKISNMDFSGAPVRIYSEDIAKYDVCLIFENCIFSSFRTSESGDNSVRFIFNNCTFKNCSGCNITLNNCYFGGSAVDGINPYQNVQVNNCYFADRSIKNSAANAGSHTDGVQIYGTQKYGTTKGVGGNIHFSNCRFEIPQLTNTSSMVNACIMLQVEFNDTDNVSFENCKLNGGGYSIYAYSKNPEFKLTDAYFKNISVGCVRKYGQIYPTKGDDVTFLNVHDTDSLYIGSVWSENNNIHISATNDTNEVRTLLVISNNGEKLINIPSCPLFNEITDDMFFSDFPFDIDINIGPADWFACYDITNGSEKQLRFYNVSGTYIKKTKP